MKGSEISKLPTESPVSFLKSATGKQYFEQVLGAKAPQIMSSLLSAVNTNDKLERCDTKSLVSAAVIAGSLDLDINSSLGLAYIVPYEKKQPVVENGKTVWKKVSKAQFQMGYKGYIQLALRSGLYVLINVTEVVEGEYLGRDRLTGRINFNWEEDDKKRAELEITGYVAYFQLNNGFEKMIYMTVEEVEEHAVKYSQAYQYDKREKKEASRWTSDFDGMAKKTVLKLLLAKWGILSVEMRKAIEADQQVDGDYVDNKKDATAVAGKVSNPIMDSVVEGETL